MLRTLLRITGAAAGLLGLAALTNGAHADIYELDKEHTEVRFTWDHLGLSRQGGRFLDVEGLVSFDPQQPQASTVDVTIPLKSISTGVAKLDEHLVKSKDFFDVAAYPTITFKSTVVKMTEPKIAEVTGDLTINGITKPVVLDVVWNFTGEHPLASINPTYQDAYYSGFSASTQILRSDWGITRTIPYVSDELRITIEAEMRRVKQPAAAASVALPPVASPAPPESAVSQPGNGLGDEQVHDIP
jgi:polyisoprenoid-binding protein YceI